MSQDRSVWRVWEGEKKLILVVTPDWDAVQGTLTRYERVDREWRKISEPIPIVVGHAGLAWDPALPRENAGRYPGPVKHEGDGRSPAGVFQLKSGTFGFAPTLQGSRMYMPLTPAIECVDDPNSRYYGKIVNRETVDQVDWKSSEKMSTIPQYRWGVVVNYNMDQPVPGDGSCVFLHQWSGPTNGTAGCTAMAGENIEEIVHWVNGDGRAVLSNSPKPSTNACASTGSCPRLAAQIRKLVAHFAGRLRDREGSAAQERFSTVQMKPLSRGLPPNCGL